LENNLNACSLELRVPIEEISLRNKSWKDILSILFYKEKLLKSFKSNNTMQRYIFTCGVVERKSNQNTIVK